ncbi:hypothetical protein PAESOLCIP111_02438 [Paenibacillus solanacearum]|uniref:Uncharacterized protein n=1 Tax=Paenibacillus solanacearum TaxID=2048548 RepID=A0A916NQB8_9BACL|nr:hypothetical protein PAESOLCIP111_02438 [Paenibacillus solanacearum]
MNYSIDISFEQNEGFTAFLKQRIRDYNNSHSSYHRKIRKEGAVRPINIMVYGEDKQWVGGIAVEVYWDWVVWDWDGACFKK